MKSECTFIKFPEDMKLWMFESTLECDLEFKSTLQNYPEKKKKKSLRRATVLLSLHVVYFTV